MYYYTEYTSPVGVLTIASDGGSIVGLWLEGQKYFLKPLLKLPERCDELPVFDRAKQWLNSYFGGEKPDICRLPLAPIGGEFRQIVWRCLCEIPYGTVTTYGEIAKKTAIALKRPSMSAQTVGGAVGHNPISILIPCHRVVGSNGSLTGYAGGLDKKIFLLELEGVDTGQYRKMGTTGQEKAHGNSESQKGRLGRHGTIL